MLAKIATTLAAMMALSHTFPAHADTWFEVEVFIFERQSNSLEQWPELSAPVKNKQLIDIITPEYSTDVTGVAIGLGGCEAKDWATDTSACNDPTVSNSAKTYPSQLPFSLSPKTPQRAYIGQDAVLLSEQQGQFKQLIRTISRDANVQGLAHMTWQQNMQSRRQAKPMRIIGGRDFSKQFSYHGQEVSKAPAEQSRASGAYSALGAFNTQTQVQPVWELDGAINIYLSHYLYIETDVFLRKITRKLMDPHHGEISGLSGTQAVQKVMMPFLQTIPLQQNRRVRSGQIHYFDHPQMGIVMQIRKMEQPRDQKPMGQDQVHSQSPSQELNGPQAVDPAYQQLEREMQQESQPRKGPEIKPYEG